MGFQVFFKCRSFLTGPKCNGGFNLPGPVFCRVRDLPGVVREQTGFQILCKAGVMAVFAGLAYENVYVMESFQALRWVSFFTAFRTKSGLPGRSSKCR